MSSTAASVGHNQPPAVPEFEPFEHRLAELTERYGDATYDLADAAQERQARSDRLLLGRVIAELDRAHQTVKAPLLEQTRVVDGERKRIKDGLRAIQDGIAEQIAAKEWREAARIEALESRVAGLRSLAEFHALDDVVDSTALRERLEQARAIDIDDGFGEFKAQAALAKVEVIAAIEKMLAEAERRETEAAELERLRQEKEERERREREERLQREAADKARQEAEEEAKREREVAAEKVEAERREAAEKLACEQRAREEAEKKAQRERETAEAKAETERLEAAERLAAEQRAREEAEQRAAEEKAAAERVAREADELRQREAAESERRAKEAAERAAREERERIEGEQQAADEKARKEADSEERRRAKQQYRAKIHAEARDALVAACEGTDLETSKDTASAIINLIKDGAVTHVQIAY